MLEIMIDESRQINHLNDLVWNMVWIKDHFEMHFIERKKCILYLNVKVFTEICPFQFSCCQGDKSLPKPINRNQWLPLEQLVLFFFFFFLAATKQLYKWFSPSVRPSVCLSVCHTFFTMFPSSYHHEIFMSYLPMTEVMPMHKVNVRGQRSRSQRSKPHLAVSGP